MENHSEAKEVTEEPPAISEDHRDEEKTDELTTDDGGKKANTKFTFHQKMTFCSAALATLVNYMAFSIISVFFPIAAKSRGVSEMMIGLVFSTYSLAAGIGAPIFGKIMPIVGARFMFLAGCFVTGGCNVLFGFIIDMPTKATLEWFSIGIRALEGLGSGASLTASSAIVAYAFPDNVGTAVSLIEMMGGLSFAIGPAIGGLIYNAGGFRLPFFVLGGLVLLTVVVNFFLMPEQGSKTEQTGSMRQVLGIPAIWVVLLAVFIGAMSMSAVDPILALHLQGLGFTVIEISLLFVSFALAYAITSVIWGAIADAKKSTRIMIVMGAFGSGLFFWLLGPTPLLKIPSTKLLAILVLPFGAAAIGLVSMPTLVDMFTTAEWYGIPSGLGLTSVLSGLWASGFAIGTTVGPTIGGTLTEHFGFENATTIAGGGCFVVMLLLCLFGIWEYRCGKGRRIPRSRLVKEAISPDEKQPLLSTDV